jgi:4-amino-4-deoxy-L-arabinose transferase-like glycosyltransferase
MNADRPAQSQTHANDPSESRTAGDRSRHISAGLAEPDNSRYQTVAGVVLLLALFGLLVVWINPLHNFPLGDDFEYARSAQVMLTTGQFYRSPVVQASALFPAVWGALFSAVLGFSFTTLRLSTLPLAAGTLVAIYLILGELGFEQARRLLGTLTLMVAPLFVFNALSFMTDVPFLFWLVLGLWCALRAFRLGRPAWLLASSVCAALAFLTRQLGLALPAAAALVVLIYRPRSDWPRWLAASVAVPLAATVLFYGTRQGTWAETSITGQGTLQFIFNLQLPAAVARRIVIMLVTLAWYMAPLWLAFMLRIHQVGSALGRLGTRLRAAAILLAVFFFGSVTYFGLRGDWWPYSQGSLTNAGLWPSLAFYAFGSDVRPPFFPTIVWVVLTYIGAVLAVVLLLSCLARFARALRERAAPLARLRSVGPSRAFTYLTFLTLLGPVLVNPLFTERYFLPFLPGAIILLLEATGSLQPAPALAGVALLAVAIFFRGAYVGLFRLA